MNTTASKFNALQILRRPPTAGFSFPASRLVITDGEDVVCESPIASMPLAVEHARGLCWHPKRFAGKFRPEVREVSAAWEY
jgi:hypothetical protein